MRSTRIGHEKSLHQTFGPFKIPCEFGRWSSSDTTYLSILLEDIKQTKSWIKCSTFYANSHLIIGLALQDKLQACRKIAFFLITQVSGFLILSK